MEIKNFIKLALLASVIMFTAPSCVKEGPMGLPGTDGINGENGQNGTATCLECHSENNLLEKQAQFVLSRHKIGEFTIDHGEWSASCVRCHTPVGFQQFAELGTAGITGAITNTELFDCSTCHGIHSTFDATDYALRITTPVDPVVVANGVMDLRGNNNLCGACHQSRSAEPNIAKPGTTFDLTVRTGPHHSPQGNIVFGNGLAEIPGSVAYPTKGESAHYTEASCIGCHMADFTAKLGGHSFIPSIAACNDCHTGADVTDYNYGGVQSDVHAKLEELATKLVALEVMAATTTDGVTTYAPIAKKGVPMLHAQAVFNYMGVEGDQSMGVHNPKYVRAILVNTLEALNK